MPSSINGHVEQSETSPLFIFWVEFEEWTEETPRKDSSGWHILGREKDPFPTNPERQKLISRVVGGWKRGDPSEKHFGVTTGGGDPSLRSGWHPTQSSWAKRRISSFLCFLGWVLRGWCPTPSIERRRPLAKSARGDIMGRGAPLPTNP